MLTFKYIKTHTIIHETTFDPLPKPLSNTLCVHQQNFSVLCQYYAHHVRHTNIMRAHTQSTPRSDKFSAHIHASLLFFALPLCTKQWQI